MKNLTLGREYKNEVLDEWREREKERTRRWQALVDANKFNVKKKAKEAYDFIKHYLSGEFGTPSEKDKKDFIFNAVERDFYACRTYFLKFGDVEGSLDCQNELDGKTALAIAAQNGDLQLVEFLLTRKANPHIRDRFGRIALHYAAASDSLETAHLLLEAGSNVDCKDRLGVRPLMLAAEVGDPDMIELLLEYAAAPNARDKAERWTALHYAAKGGDVDCVIILLKNGVKYNILSVSEKSAQDIALDHKNQEAAIVLGKWRRRKLFPANKFSLQAIEDIELFDGVD